VPERAPRPLRCLHCAYDLRAVAGDTCPECGRDWSPAAYARYLARRRRRAAALFTSTAVLAVLSTFAVPIIDRQAPGIIFVLTLYLSWATFCIFGYVKIGLRWYMAAVAGPVLAVLLSALSLILATLLVR
jgi:hypothetical protein